ncbi:hypothetical protein CHUAL_003756 [Chamberlinius hualienensis]
MPCSGFNGGTIEFDATADSEFCAGAGDWAFPSPISDETSAVVTRHDHGSDDHRRSQSSTVRDKSINAAAGASLTAAASDQSNHQNILMCIPHLEDERNFNSSVSEMRDSTEFSIKHEDVKMDVDQSQCNGNVNASCNVNDRKEDESKGMETKGNVADVDPVLVTGVSVQEEEEEEVEDEEEDDELFFQPPRRISMLWNSKLRWKEERKKVLKISVSKLRTIEDPELSLCRAILINNTMKRLHREIRDEKLARYPDVIRPVPMVTAYHLANCNNASIPEAFPRKRSSSTSTSSSNSSSISSSHNTTNHVYDYSLDTYCSNDKENRNCSVDSGTTVVDYMNIDNSSDSMPSPAKRARLMNAKSDVNNSCYSSPPSNGETSALMVDVNDYRNNDLRTATSSPLACHQQYQTSAFTSSPSCAQNNSFTGVAVVNGQLVEISEPLAKNTSVKHDVSQHQQNGNHLMSLDCCTKEEISHFSNRFTNLTTTTTSTSTTNNCLTSPPSPKDKRDLMAAEYEKQYSQYSCGQVSIFGELQSVVFHSLITSLES